MSTAEIGPIAVAEFDAAAAPDAAAELVPCCASKRWVSQLVSGRPYGRLDRLTAASDAVLGGLAWADLEEALAAHPRIGQRPPGAGREAHWSAQEQAGTKAATDDVQRELNEGNRAYEQRFGYVFLICATGLSAAEMLTALTARLQNDPVAEREVARSELAKIVRLRLAKAFRS